MPCREMAERSLARHHRGSLGENPLRFYSSDISILLGESFPMPRPGRESSPRFPREDEILVFKLTNLPFGIRPL